MLSILLNTHDAISFQRIEKGLNNACLSVFKLQEQHDAIKFLLHKHDASIFRYKQKVHELPNPRTNIAII